MAALIAAGCARPRAVTLQDGFDSPESLAGAVLAAYAAGDAEALMRYALTEHELRTAVWPHLPASRPDVGMDWDYFWRDHHQRNQGHLRTLLREHAGKRYELAGLSFDGRAAYGPVTIHRETALDLRTPSGAARLRLFGSMAEIGGRWKLYSFVVD